MPLEKTIAKQVLALDHHILGTDLLHAHTKGDPGSAQRGDHVVRLPGELELGRPMRLLLHDNGALGDDPILDHIVDTEDARIAASQLAVIIGLNNARSRAR